MTRALTGLPWLAYALMRHDHYAQVWEVSPFAWVSSLRHGMSWPGALWEGVNRAELLPPVTDRERLVDRVHRAYEQWRARAIAGGWDRAFAAELAK
jgi:hypothetical protein